jgi:outer membrane protein OmpA-like peptidoglycan-associated protein
MAMNRAGAWVLLLLLASCAEHDDAADRKAAAAASASEAGTASQQRDAPLHEMPAEPDREQVDTEARRATNEVASDTVELIAAIGDQTNGLMDEAMRAQPEIGGIHDDPNSTDAGQLTAMEAMILAMQEAVDAGDTGDAGDAEDAGDFNAIQPELDLPPDWAATYRVERDGDDPFSGKSTPIHPFPGAPEADDPAATDRIMVNSGAVAPTMAEGYTAVSIRPDNLPQPLVIEFEPTGITVQAALLQLYLDDFQAPVMGTRFSVALDGQPAPDLANTINRLNQTGPIGKLITIKLLPEYLGLLADGKLAVFVDDPITNVGDGFAFDFARLLINPKGFTYSGTIRGIVVDVANGQPLEGTLVSAANVQNAVTGTDGKFEFKEVPAGLAVLTGSHPDYVTGSEQRDLSAGEVVEIMLRLERVKHQDLARRLETEGKIDLYGIYFDTDKATLRPESAQVLEQVLTMLKDQPELRIAIAGHTDSEGSDRHNLDLSQRRAQAVVKWLTDNGIAVTRLEAHGHGESQPVADNGSAAGRALNRRVELRDLTR